jgi:hypothetical protein
MTCDLHDGQPTPCRVCALLVPAIVSAAAREYVEAAQARQLAFGSMTSGLRHPIDRAERKERRQGLTCAQIAARVGLTASYVAQLVKRGETAASILDGSYHRGRA